MDARGRLGLELDNESEASQAAIRILIGRDREVASHDREVVGHDREVVGCDREIALVMHQRLDMPTIKSDGVLGKHLGRIGYAEGSGWMEMKEGETIEETVDVFVMESGWKTFHDEDLWTWENATLPKSARTFLEKKINGLVPEENVDVSEFLSPPRLTEAARRSHLRAGSALDLTTGWDFSRSADRKAAHRLLEVERPALLML